MNLPNKLSMLRMILVPFMIIFMIPIPIAVFAGWNGFVENYGMIIALIIFSVASYTDHLDGKIARRDNLITDLGQLLDPIADKFLVISAFIALAALGRTTAWVPVIVLLRELLVTGLRSVAATKGVVVPAKWFGKFKAVIQYVTIIALMIENILNTFISSGIFMNFVAILCNILIILTLVFTILSGVSYLNEHKDLLNE